MDSMFLLALTTFASVMMATEATSSSGAGITFTLKKMNNRNMTIADIPHGQSVTIVCPQPKPGPGVKPQTVHLHDAYYNPEKIVKGHCDIKRLDLPELCSFTTSLNCTVTANDPSIAPGCQKSPLHLIYYCFVQGKDSGRLMVNMMIDDV